MTNVLMTYESRVITAVILEGMIEGFSQMMGCHFTSKAASAVKGKDLEECDVLICVRGESPLSTELMKRARQAGRYVIFFLDDDLQHLPKDAFRYPSRKKHLLEGLKYADGFLTSSRLLAEEYVPLMAGDRWGMLETSIGAEEVVTRQWQQDDGIVRLVYAGASTHTAQWKKFLEPIWNDIAQKFGSGISLTFVGMHPEMPEDNHGAVVEFVPPMPLTEFRAYMIERQFDIGLSPLETNHFTERKYYNKFLEYGRCGTCGVYSKCAPYTLIVEDGENGILVDNDPAAWQQALERVIGDAALRQRCIENSQQILRNRFTKESVFRQLAEDFPEMVHYKSPPNVKITISPAVKANQFLFRVMERSYLTMLSLKRDGLKKTISRIRKKFK